MAKKFPIFPKAPERICWGCDKATKPQTVQIVRQGEATRTGLKLIHYISTIHQEIDPTRAEPPLPISLANILNFKYGISSNSVIPAQAGIHFLNSETVFQIKVSQVLRWIPACAGMTTADKCVSKIK